MFAALLAKLNPMAQQPAVATATNTIPQPRKDTKVAPMPATQQDNDNPSSDAAALAAMQNMAPLPARAATPLPKGSDAISDALSEHSKPFADLKTVDPAQLRAALMQPATPAKPGTPTLPVMPAHGDDEDGEEAASKIFDAKNAPALPAIGKAAAAAAQHLLRPATPAQTTEAQALPVKQDAKQDGQSSTDSGDKNSSHDQPSYQQAQTNAQPAQPATHAQTAPAHAPQAATQIAEAKSAAPANTVTGIGAAASTQNTAQSSATLQVTQASHASPQPDIAGLAVNIAAKSQGGAKHFDIRLDPPELGHIEVHLSVDDSGNAQAHLTADKPQTLTLLQRDQGTLHSALKESGVDLGNNGLQFSLRGQDRDGGNASRSFSRGRALAVSAVTEAASSTPSIASVASDRLDIRV